MAVWSRYGSVVRWYDLYSGERAVYRAGREAGLDMLPLRPGDVVIDLGCGTGLNFAALRRAVGETGLVVGVDLSTDMIAVAAARVAAAGWRNVRLVRADAASLDGETLRSIIRQATSREAADAVVSTYALSVMGEQAPEAWARAVSVVRDGGWACVVDMQPPTGRWRVLSPIARLACALGGADIGLRPWRLLESSADPASVERARRRGGHLVAVVGRLGSS